MKNENKQRIDKLAKEHSLSLQEYEALLTDGDSETAAYLTEKAMQVKQEWYGDTVFIRGLIEISNICKNDCYYCGIRKSNAKCQRYRLTKQQILDCCKTGYEIGFRTFVLQGGEDAYFNDERLADIVSRIKSSFPDCAITLSMGERSFASYRKLKLAGADRYLLRHETSDEEHYRQLHPAEMSREERLQCLEHLRELGYQVGCGFMVGSPYQTDAMLAAELKFIETFHPEMCGIGPFIPHKDTPFGDRSAGSADMTCRLLSLIRLISPGILLPATTALGTLEKDGRLRGIQAGANVVMPNLSPYEVRDKYMLYDNKLHAGAESAQELEKLKADLATIQSRVVVSRGDALREKQ